MHVKKFCLQQLTLQGGSKNRILKARHKCNELFFLLAAYRKAKLLEVPFRSDRKIIIPFNKRFQVFITAGCFVEVRVEMTKFFYLLFLIIIFLPIITIFSVWLLIMPYI
jgi:hypothetical protein